MKVELENGTLNCFIPSSDKIQDEQMEGDVSSSGSSNEMSGEGMKKNTAVAGDENAEQPISNQSNSEIEEISLKRLVVKSPDKSTADVEHKKNAGLFKSTDENINPAIKFRCPFCDVIVCGNAEFLKHILRHGENYMTDDKTFKPSENDEKPDKIAIKNSKRLKFRLSHPSMKSLSTIRSKQTKSSDPPISKAPLQARKKNKKIPCKICKNMYYTHYMSSHMTVHTGERNFSCLFCPQAFAVYCNLKAHMGSLHKKTLNLASYRELSAEKSKLREKQVKNPSATASSPKHTPETVDSAANTEPEPSTEPSKGKSKTVSKCKKRLEKSSNRRNFQRSHGKSYKCQLCPKRFKAQSTLKYHQFTHSEERPFKCQFCDVACRHPSNLNSHIKRHHKNEKQADNFKEIESVPSTKRSTRTTSSSVELNSYDNDSNQEDTKAISLIQKDEETELKTQKTRETRKRKGSKSFMSPSPPTSPSLKKKRRKGKRSEKSQCWFSNCGKTFGSNQALEIHYRVHTKEKPYHCDTCSKKFSQISSLHRHKKAVHLGIKSYKCPYCDKATSSSWNMKLHIHAMHKKLASVDSKVK